MLIVSFIAALGHLHIAYDEIAREKRLPTMLE